MEEPTYKRINVSIELIEIINKQKEKINDFAWDALKITDVEATKVIARKIKEAGLDK